MSAPEDVSAQRAAVESARQDLTTALEALSDAASVAARAGHSKARKPPPFDLGPVHTWRLAVERREQTLDLALYDLHTAAGGDG